MQVSGSRQLELLGELGRGGFGSVYLANLRGSDGFVRRVAVKVMRPGLRVDPQLLARQRDEARLLGLLSHPAVVQVLDLASIDGRPAVVMEYIEGLDAARILDQVSRAGNRIPERATLELVGAAASALDAVYTSVSPESGEPLRVIHRDIKPANLLVTAHGTVKVLDFGVARAEFNREGVTGSVFFGTAAYMAPEFWLGEPIGPAYDVYALGVTLLELLTGVPPERIVADRRRYQASLATRLGEVRGVQPGTIDLLASMLAFDASDRPSAGEVEDQAAGLVGRASGESLARFSRLLLPPLLSARREGVERAAVADDPAEPGLRAGYTIQLGEDVAPRAPSRARLLGGVGSAAVLATVVAVWLWMAGQGGVAEEGADGSGGAAVASGPTASSESPVLPENSALPENAYPARSVPPQGAAAPPPENTAALGTSGGRTAAPPEGASSSASPPAPSSEAVPTNGEGARGASSSPRVRGDDLVGPAGTPPTDAAAGGPPSSSGDASSAGVSSSPVALALPAAVADLGGATADGATRVGPAAAPIEVMIGSVPIGAQVRVDNYVRGTTPLTLRMGPGSHVVALSVAGRTVQRTVEIGEGAPNVYSYDADTGVWTLRVK